MPYTFPKPEHPASVLRRCLGCNGINQRAPHTKLCGTCEMDGHPYYFADVDGNERSTVCTGWISDCRLHA